MFKVACRSKATHPLTLNIEVVSRSARNFKLLTFNFKLI